MDPLRLGQSGAKLVAHGGPRDRDNRAVDVPERGGENGDDKDEAGICGGSEIRLKQWRRGVGPRRVFNRMRKR